MENREIACQHATLRKTLARIQSLSAASISTAGDDLVSAVRSLQSDLRRHFDFEERDGYLKVVLESRPGLGRQVEKLRMQHGAILTELQGLIEEPDEHLASGVNRLLKVIRKHEAAESDLLQEAVTIDLGNAD